MTIKQYAFQVHAYLLARGSASLTRGQVHELLAAAAGFATHAAFHHQAAWCDVAWRDAGLAPDEDRVIQRSLHFGLSPDEAARVAQSLVSFLDASGYAPVRFEELITALASDEDEWAEADEAESGVVSEWLSIALITRMQEGFDGLLGELPLLLEGLEAAAARGISAAHLATAYMLKPYAGLSDEDDRRFGRELHRHGQWWAEPVGFAEITPGADRFVRVVAKHRYHLLAAARGRNRRAMLLTAKRYGDPGALELDPSDEMDPYAKANLANAHGHSELAFQWLTELAREGDVSAMRVLIEDRGETPLRAWVWMHLSRLLDRDLSRDWHEAINEDGTSYDDDVGGPAYVGGVSGIELAPLAAEEDRPAKEEAARLFAVIEERYELNSSSSVVGELPSGGARQDFPMKVRHACTFILASRVVAIGLHCFTLPSQLSARAGAMPGRHGNSLSARSLGSEAVFPYPINLLSPLSRRCPLSATCSRSTPADECQL